MSHAAVTCSRSSGLDSRKHSGSRLEGEAEPCTESPLRFDREASRSNSDSPDVYSPATSSRVSRSATPRVFANAFYSSFKLLDHTAASTAFVYYIFLYAPSTLDLGCAPALGQPFDTCLCTYQVLTIIRLIHS